MLLINVVTAFLCAAGITASPTPRNPGAVAERDNAELDRRLLGIDLGVDLDLGLGNKGCKDWWKVNECKKKGMGCNAKCECEHPPEKYCDPHVKKDCEAKHSPRFVYSHEKCKCEDKGCPSDKKHQCEKNGGTYNDHTCYCQEKPKCPDHVKWDCEAKKSPRYVFNKEHCRCDDVGCPKDKKSQCEKNGGTYNDHTCYCKEKPKCPDHVKWDCEAKKSPRFVFNKEHCRCDDVGCPAEHKHKCEKDGGKYDNEKCVCQEKPKCPDHVKWDCEAKKSPRFVFNKEHCRCDDVGCPHGAKEKCEHEQGTYNSHECKCYPKKKTCDEHKVKECEKWGGEFNHEHCACYPKKEEQCKDWLRLLICKKLGKSCNNKCDCY